MQSNLCHPLRLKFNLNINCIGNDLPLHVCNVWKCNFNLKSFIFFRNWNYSLHVLHFIHSAIMFSYIWKQKECRYLEFTTSFNLKMSISAFTYLLQNWMWIQSDMMMNSIKYFFLPTKKSWAKKSYILCRKKEFTWKMKKYWEKTRPL